MKDVTGKEVFIGDKVAFPHLSHTDKLVVGNVIGFSTKKIKIEYPFSDSMDVCLKFPSQVAILHNSTSCLSELESPKIISFVNNAEGAFSSREKAVGHRVLEETLNLIAKVYQELPLEIAVGLLVFEEKLLAHFYDTASHNQSIKQN